MRKQLLPRSEKQEVKPMDVISQNCRLWYFDIMKNKK
jgi:hypothetical protein